MANEVTTMRGKTIMPMPSSMNDVDFKGKLTDGVAISFPMLGIRDKVFHYRWKGDDAIIPSPENPKFPAQYINVVIVDATNTLVRTYYPPNSYNPEQRNRPTCYSSDGVRPDQSVPEPVSPACATCKNSVWGSGASEVAPRAQACQQRRRVVIVPYSSDLTNEGGGGPMLFSVPPGSLAALRVYGDWLDTHGLIPPAVVTQISFADKSKMVFEYERTLDQAECDVIKQVIKHEQVGRILQSRIEVDGPEAEDGAPVEAGPPKPAGAAPMTAGQQQPPKAAEVKPAPTVELNIPPTAEERAKVKAAPQPEVKPSPGRVGGFGVGVPAQAQPNPAPINTQPKAPIEEAVRKPAEKPATKREVNVAPKSKPPAPQATEDDEAFVGGGSVADEFDDHFANMMNRK